MGVYTLLYSFKLRFYTFFTKKRFGKFGKNSFIVPTLNQLVGGRSIYVGDSVKIGKMATLTTWVGQKNKGSIQIGSGAKIGDFIHVSAIDHIEIGENVLTGRWVTIVDNSHGDISDCDVAPIMRELKSKGPVIIGNNVWLADKVTICPGVTIGEGSIVGANSVVTKSIPPYSVAAGVPARIISQLNKDEQH
jgi:acetyltransferase-like isoleucine patch superfamily enzyme